MRSEVPILTFFEVDKIHCHLLMKKKLPIGIIFNADKILYHCKENSSLQTNINGLSKTRKLLKRLLFIIRKFHKNNE